MRENWFLPWDILREEELIEFIKLNEELDYNLTLENQANLIYSEDGKLTENVRYLKK